VLRPAAAVAVELEDVARKELGEAMSPNAHQAGSATRSPAELSGVECDKPFGHAAQSWTTSDSVQPGAGGGKAGAATAARNRHPGVLATPAGGKPKILVDNSPLPSPRPSRSSSTTPRRRSDPASETGLAGYLKALIPRSRHPAGTRDPTVGCRPNLYYRDARNC